MEKYNCLDSANTVPPNKQRTTSWKFCPVRIQNHSCKQNEGGPNPISTIRIGNRRFLKDFLI